MVDTPNTIDIFSDNPSLSIENMTRETARLKKEFAQLTKIGGQFAKTINASFANAIANGKNFSQILRNIVLQISKIALKNALKPITNSITPLLGNLAANITASAKAQSPNLASIIPFAQGGIINTPSVFRLPGGKTGLAGESGPEAVIPLERTQNGKLGIRANQNHSPQTIIFNINTPDANSFIRSKTQIEAMIARAALRGQRNL